MQTKLLKFVLKKEYNFLNTHKPINIESSLYTEQQLKIIEKLEDLLSYNYCSVDISSKRGFNPEIEMFVPLILFGIYYQDRLYKNFSMNRERFYGYEKEFERIEKFKKVIKS